MKGTTNEKSDDVVSKRGYSPLKDHIFLFLASIGGIAIIAVVGAVLLMIDSPEGLAFFILGMPAIMGIIVFFPMWAFWVALKKGKKWSFLSGFVVALITSILFANVTLSLIIYLSASKLGY